MKSWSCVDLHYSLYLAPDVVRTCCQRFFVDNKIRGDVELFKVNTDMSNLDFVDKALSAKQELYNDINDGKDTDCSGCPFLSYEDWPSISDLKVRHLSLEYHSICNLKCTYCSDTYYGGMSPNYNVKGVLSELHNNNALDPCKTIVWGGGEPLADKKFEEIFQYLIKNTNAEYKIFTNAIKYSKLLNDLISRDLVTITTSIDAGTVETYKKIRGGEKLYFVIKNLNRYSSIRPDNVIIKYVFTDGNSSLSEVESFIELIKESNLDKCYFQISFDYYLEGITEKQLTSIIIMYGLIKNDLRSDVFLDDLLWHRMSNSFHEKKENILRKIKSYGYDDFIANHNDYKSVVIWGAGKIATDIISDSDFLKHVQVEYIVDSNVNEIQKMFHGKNVYKPEVLLNDNSMIIIAAAYAYSSIIKDFHKIGINTNRIVQGLII
jgi:molybdenum cofactor biosynthesis enzyme MoaA